MKKIAAIAVLGGLMMSGPAMAAEECTEAMLEERQGKLMAFMQANPDKAEAVMGLIEQVEEKHGGEPPREKQCEAMDEVLAGAEAL